MLTSETSETGIKSNIVPILKEPGRFAQNILSRENSSGWDIPSTKWKASLCHRRHTLAVQHRGKILSEMYSNIISSTVISLVEILLKDHLQSVLGFFLNGSWEAWAIFFQGLAKHESLLDPANPPGLGFASLFRDLAVDPLLTPPRETDKLVIFIHIQH